MKGTVHTAGVDQNLGETSSASSSDLPPHSLTEVDDTRPNSETPTLVAQTMFRVVEGERVGIGGVPRITDEAASSMRVKTNHEKECEVVSVPKGFETLVANLVVGSGIHEDHNEEHEVSRDTASLGIMNIESNLRANL